jgi:hypothetical protein
MGRTTMRAVTQDALGGPEVLKVSELERAGLLADPAACALAEQVGVAVRLPNTAFS